MTISRSDRRRIRGNSGQIVLEYFVLMAIMGVLTVLTIAGLFSTGNMGSYLRNFYNAAANRIAN